MRVIHNEATYLQGLPTLQQMANLCLSGTDWSEESIPFKPKVLRASDMLDIAFKIQLAGRASATVENNHISSASLRRESDSNLWRQIH